MKSGARSRPDAAFRRQGEGTVIFAAGEPASVKLAYRVSNPVIGEDDQTEAGATPEVLGLPVPSTGSPPVPVERCLSDHGDVLWRFAFGRTRSRQDAEDIVQETILAALQGHQAFEGQSSERTWLLGIAAHKIADHFRRVRRVRRAASRSVRPGPSDAACTCATCRGMFTENGMWATIAGNWPDAGLNEAEKAEQVAALRACIEALPPGQAEAVWLRDILGIPAGEVRKAMGLTDSNFWTRMHRARVALRSCLEAKFGMRTGKRP